MQLLLDCHCPLIMAPDAMVWGVGSTHPVLLSDEVYWSELGSTGDAYVTRAAFDISTANSRVRRNVVYASP
jgi:hypothetical protein